MIAPPEIPDRSSSMLLESTNTSPQSTSTSPVSAVTIESTTLTLLSTPWEREVENLYNIADHKWHDEPQSKPEPQCDTYNVNHDAEAITKLVITSSLATRDPSSAQISRFLERYYELAALDMNEISYEGIQYILQEFFQRFDEIFFFDLLNREVQSVRPSHRRKLVVIKAYDWSGPGIDGQFQVIYDYIDIWLRGGDKGHRYPFEYLICVLLHEMTHAYLGIFADEKDDKYDEHVADYKTHGTMFWMLLNFLLRRVFEVTRSEVVWDEILGEEARRFESVDKPRYRRFFEKILKIF